MQNPVEGSKYLGFPFRNVIVGPEEQHVPARLVPEEESQLFPQRAKPIRTCHSRIRRQ
jgi:hypothetical protein